MDTLACCSECRGLPRVPQPALRPALLLRAADAVLRGVRVRSGRYRLPRRRATEWTLDPRVVCSGRRDGNRDRRGGRAGPADVPVLPRLHVLLALPASAVRRTRTVHPWQQPTLSYEPAQAAEGGERLRVQRAAQPGRQQCAGRGSRRVPGRSLTTRRREQEDEQQKYCVWWPVVSCDRRWKCVAGVAAALFAGLVLAAVLLVYVVVPPVAQVRACAHARVCAAGDGARRCADGDRPRGPQHPLALAGTPAPAALKLTPAAPVNAQRNADANSVHLRAEVGLAPPAHCGWQALTLVIPRRARL
jgi:hypothetical protein